MPRIFLLAAFLVSLLQGQTPQQAPAQPATDSADALSTTPLFHTNSNLVLVDVVVTGSGGAVHGLGRGSFHIFEDGVEQDIRSFDEHASPVQSAQGKPVPQLPAGDYTNIPRYPPSTAVDVILLDMLNTPIEAQSFAQLQVMEFLKKARPGSLTAVFTLDSRLHLAAGFTAEPSEISRAITAAATGPHGTLLFDPEGDKERANEIANVPSQVEKSNPGLAESLKNMNARGDADRVHDRVSITLHAFAQLAQILERVPGRKNLIWISGSFPLAIASGASPKESDAGGENFMAELNNTSKRLAAARVAVYPIDARGLSGLPAANSVDRYNTGSGYVDSKRVVHMAGDSDDQKFLSSLTDEHTSMRQIAATTGGKPYVNTNGIANAISDAVEDGANYYSIGYVPAQQKLDGKFHSILVKLDGRHDVLSYRNGYLADTRATAGKSPLAEIPPQEEATLHGAPPATQIGIVARIVAANSQDAKGVVLDEPPQSATAPISPFGRPYIVELLIDPHPIAFELSSAGTRSSTLQLALISYSRDGRRLGEVDRHADIQIPPGNYAQAMKDGVPMRLQLDLPAGFEFLRIAVRDPMTGRLGSLEVPVSVPSKKS